MSPWIFLILFLCLQSFIQAEMKETTFEMDKNSVLDANCLIADVQHDTEIECARDCTKNDQCKALQFLNGRCILSSCALTQQNADKSVYLRLTKCDLEIEGKCFYTITYKGDFNTANSVCIARGLKLAEPSSANQISTLVSNVPVAANCSDGYYIGLLNPDERLVTDSNNNPLTFDYDSLWAAGQPDFRNQIKMAIRGGTYKPGLYDRITSHEHCVICEP